MSHQISRIILHADDFGRTIETTTSVLRCIDRNVITSVTAMANAPGTDHALAAVLPLQHQVSVGVHLNFCEGQPLTDVPTLVDERGQFFSKRSVVVRAVLNRFSASDLERECTAQLSRVRDAGIAISHIDGHKHLHLVPHVAPIVARVARRFGVERVRCPVDGRSPDWRRRASGFVRSRFGRLANRHFSAAGLRHPDRLIDVTDLIGAANRDRRVTLLAAPMLLTEVMCHPRQAEPRPTSTMTDAEFLMSDQFSALLADTQAVRCTYWDC
jgi:predicted glycoside hydrolase/deacetylase ChbG (UPF0249 family)